MRILLSGFLLTQFKKFISERFAALKRESDKGQAEACPLFAEVFMENIKLYEISEKYINYLLPYAPHLFHNSKENQKNKRKYIGVILRINEINYFAPLSSYKEKHKQMKEALDFIKIKKYAVINLNNMFPAPINECKYVDINNERNIHYKALLRSEYRFIKSIQEKVRKNAALVYNHKLKNGNSTALAKRCNDFLKLEDAYKNYIKIMT